MTTGERPLVSAIITTQNRPELFLRALESALAQTYAPIEIVVVDDASSDDTRERIRNHPAAGRIRYHRHDTARGACAARNTGIEVATGEFLAGLDDDDEWLPHRIEALMDAYEDRFAFVGSRSQVVQAGRSFTLGRPGRVNLGTIRRRNVVGNQVLVRTRRMREIGGFDESLVAAQDLDVWIRLIERFGPALVLPSVTQIVHGEHETKRVSGQGRPFRGNLALYRKHKARMSRDERRLRLAAVYRVRGKPMSWRRFFQLVPPGEWGRWLTYLLRTRAGRWR